jgi:hypothetical protein
MGFGDVQERIDGSTGNTGMYDKAYINSITDGMNRPKFRQTMTFCMSPP